MFESRLPLLGTRRFEHQKFLYVMLRGDASRYDGILYTTIIRLMRINLMPGMADAVDMLRQNRE